MQPRENSDSPEEHPPQRINPGKERIGWRKYKPVILEISSRILIGILLVLAIPLLPVIGPLFLLNRYHRYKHRKAVENGVLTSELSASQKTTVYLDGNAITGFLGTTDIEYAKNAKNASFNYRNGNGRYKVYGTYEEGLFMLVPVRSKINPRKSKKSSYYQCEVVRVDGGYNHGDFGEKSPMGSSDCIVLIWKKASKFPPSKDLIVIETSEATERHELNPGEDK